MSLQTATRHGSKPLAGLVAQACRAYSTTPAQLADAATKAKAKAAPAPASAGNSDETPVKRRFYRRGKVRYGALRRKAAIKDMDRLPFELHPYQCFQEARQIIADDRAIKLQQIEAQRAKIALHEARDVAAFGGETMKKSRLMGMRRHLEWLKVQVDINDPVTKKRFEDGLADMNKPIYRYLAEEKWRSYDRKITVQRLTTMKIIPDVFPGLDPKINVSLLFRRRKINAGDFVPSVISEPVPSLSIQAYDKGPRYYTVAIVDPDVPDLATDAFSNRVHFLASNILIDPSNATVSLEKLAAEQVVIPWLPPHAQKGSPYHRLCTFVFEQPGRLEPAACSEKETDGTKIRGGMIDVAKAKERLGDSRGYGANQLAAKFGLRPVGAHIFRTIWDEWMAGVMGRNGIDGADVELKRKRGEKLPPKKRDTERYR